MTCKEARIMTDKKRDLHADLALCEAATPGVWDIELEGKWANVDTYIEGIPGYPYICQYCKVEDARFIAEAREGWPHAIRRALEAGELIAELMEENKGLRAELEQVKKDRDGWHEAFKKACVLEHRAVKARNALKEELDELRKIVSSECPVGALDIVNSLRVEKAHMQERIKELEAENDLLKKRIADMEDEVAAWKKIALGFDKFREGEE